MLGRPIISVRLGIDQCLHRRLIWVERHDPQVSFAQGGGAKQVEAKPATAVAAGSAPAVDERALNLAYWNAVQAVFALATLRACLIRCEPWRIPVLQTIET